MIEHLYTIREMKTEADGFIAGICLNADDFIYKAHFPGHPITPGVCIVQILHELVERQCGMRLRLRSAKNVKFLSILDPTVHPVVRFEVKCAVEDNAVKVSAIMRNDDVIFARLATEMRLM
jgi:3-hydroxyacyl-[acyl-carrier-protein] dehydratase